MAIENPKLNDILTSPFAQAWFYIDKTLTADNINLNH